MLLVAEALKPRKHLEPRPPAPQMRGYLKFKGLSEGCSPSNLGFLLNIEVVRIPLFEGVHIQIGGTGILC